MNATGTVIVLAMVVILATNAVLSFREIREREQDIRVQAVEIKALRSHVAYALERCPMKELRP